VLTLRGESFAGRVAASLLDAVGLPDLAVDTAEDYERRAVELGSDRAASQALKDRLAAQRQATPLFATARFTRDIEQAFTRMHERHLAGEAPGHIELPASPA
jgi:protein O-GlcNAc transferase